MKLKNILWIVGLFSILSCKKEELPQIVEGEIELTFQGEINNKLVQLNAGLNDYYLFSSKSVNSDGVRSYSSEFKKTNCTNCKESLKITFYDYAFENTQTDSTFYKGYYNFATSNGKPSRYLVGFTKTTLGPPNNEISWDFGDNSGSSEFNPTHFYARPGIYTVCADANFVDLTSSNLCHKLSLGNIGDFLEVNLIVGTIINKSVNFSSTVNFGTPPYSYLWNFGDGIKSNETNLIHTYANEGVYNVSLTVTDVNGIQETQNQNIRTENATNSILRFNYAINPINNPFNLGNVKVEWTDENGTIYTSQNDSQEAKSYFKIISIEEYKANEQNNATKKMKIEFSCLLFSGTDQLEVRNAEAIIAVEY